MPFTSSSQVSVAGPVTIAQPVTVQGTVSVNQPVTVDGAVSVTGSVVVANTAPLEVQAGGSAVDAFGRIRVSQNVPLLASAFDFARGGGQVLLDARWTGLGVNGATRIVNTNAASVTLRVTTTVGSKYQHQTKEYFLYRAAQSHAQDCTFYFGAADATVRRRAGYFDDSDGIYFEQSDDLYMVIRSAVTGVVLEERIKQSNWNVDPFNGLGPSGITLNLEATQIFAIDLQFLGVGRVRVGFNIGGSFVGVHEFNHANDPIYKKVYMRSATLPVRYELERIAGGAVATADLEAICAAVIREGSEMEPGISRSTSVRGAALATNNTNWRVVLAIQLKSGSIRACLREFAGWVYANDTTNGVEFIVALNPTLTGGGTTGGRINVGTWVDLTNSIAQVARPAAGTVLMTIDTGYEMLTSIAPPGRQGGATAPVRSTENLPVVADISGNSDYLVLAVRSLSGTPNIGGGLNWREVM